MKPDIAALEARLAAATLGDWTLEPYGDDGELGAGDIYAHDAKVLICNDVMGHDAAFIVAAHNDMADVLAYVRTLEALLTEHFDRDEYASRMDGQRDGDYWYCFDCKQQAYEHDDIKHTADCLRTRTAVALGLDKDT